MTARKKAYMLEYNQQPENRERARVRNRKWASLPENREKLRILMSQWLKKPENRLASNLRCRIRQALVRNSKTDSTKELVGCSFSKLKEWLEFWMKPGMTWENYGDWHVDHKKPCASFDLSKPEEQKRCFHYTNLEPLWAKDNLSKGARIL